MEETLNSRLENLVTELKTNTEERQKISDLIAIKKEEFEKSISDLVDQQIPFVNRLGELKTEIDRTAITLFEETGIKKLYGGIGIRETKTLSYDNEKALNFAKEKNMFLALDKKAFDKVAVSLNLDFVESGTVSKVTYPKVIKLEKERKHD